MLSEDEIRCLNSVIANLEEIKSRLNLFYSNSQREITDLNNNITRLRLLRERNS